MSADRLLRRVAAGPIFVLGGARSGANWAYELLSAHPEVAGVRESRVFDRVEGEEARRESAQVFGSAVGDERFVVERSASHIFKARAIAEAWPEARFVHVLRDGRDVAVRAWLKQADWPDDWKKRFGSGFTGAARAWAESVNEARELAKEHPSRVLEVRFEDINHDHRVMAARIFRFCGIPYDDPLLDDILMANDRRLDRPTNLDAWKDHLSIYRAFLMERAIGDTLRATDYERSRTWWWRPLRRT